MKHNGKILRLLFVNWALGIGLGVAFASAVLWFDLGGLYSLIARSSDALVATALLYGGFSVTCGGVVCASAIMRLPQGDEPSPPSADAVPTGLVPVPAVQRRR